MKLLCPTLYYYRLNKLARNLQHQPLTAFPQPDISGQTCIALHEDNVHSYFANFVNHVNKIPLLSFCLSYIPYTKEFKTRHRFVCAIHKYQRELYHNMQYPGFQVVS